MSRSGRWLGPALTGGAGLLLWIGIKAHWQIPSYILPGPGEVLRAAAHERATLLAAAWTTSLGAVLGLLLAVLVGFGLSLLMAFTPLMRASLYPYVLVCQMIPVVILAPVFVLWLGPGLPSVVVITLLICFFPIVANTTQGLISVDQNMLDLFRLCHARRWQELLWLRVPFALPYFLTGLRISGSLAMIGAVAGDMFAGNAAGGTGGLGYMVIIYNAQLKIPALYATAFVACACGFVFVSLVLALNWLLLRRWHDSIARRDV